MNLNIPPFNKKGKMEAPIKTRRTPINRSPFTHPMLQQVVQTHSSPGLPNSTQHQHQVVQVTKVSYKNFIITVFTDSVEKSPRQFYFQPLVLLDPKSVVQESNTFLKEEFVRFSVQMWNQELRSKVLEGLRSLPSMSKVMIREDDVYIMPFKKVRLIFKQSSVHHKSIQLAQQPSAYILLNETLDFYLRCDTSSTAGVLAEDLRNNPGSTLNGLQLALECRDLVLDPVKTEAVPHKRPMFIFSIATAPGSNQSHGFLETKSSVSGSVLFKELKIKGVKVNDTEWTNGIPVFSVCHSRISADFRQPIMFKTEEFETETELGDFALETGFFTVKTAGVYQFSFSAYRKVMNSSDYSTDIELRVDGVKKTSFHSQQSESEEMDYEPISFSSTLSLKQGQKVGVFRVHSELYTASPLTLVRFYGILVYDE